MFHNWEWDAAEKELKRAIELNPSYPSAHHWYSEYFSAMGSFDEALEETKRAGELDPLSVVITAHTADILYLAGRYDQAIKEIDKTRELDADFWLNFSYIHRGKSYAQKRMYPEAISELQKARALSIGDTEVLARLGFVCAVAGRKDEALSILGELNEKASRSPVPPYHFAIIYAGLGEKDQGADLGK